nr:hypothetical protein [Tanacetum cinerariifolium]
MTAAAAGKAVAVAAVGVAMVLVVGRDDGVMEAAGGVGGGAWHGGCCHGGAGCRRRCMAMVDGGSYRSEYEESFWGSSENLAEKLFWRRSWWWPTAAVEMWDKRMRSIISMVSISLEGFLPFILLLVVIIVAVILVVVVIDAIVGVVIVVASIGVVVVVMIIGIVIVDGGVSHIIKLSFVIIGISLGLVFLLGLSAFAMAVAYASRTAATPSVISCRMVSSVIAGVADKEFKTSRDRHGNNGMSDSIGGLDTKSNEDPSDKDGGSGIGDSTRVSVSLGEISLERNKSWELNIGDSDNTRDRGKIAGRAITT